MSAHHLVVNCRCYVVDGEFTSLLRDLCIEDYLKQQVAEFVAEFARPAFTCVFDGFKRLVSFLEKHRRKRGVSLFAIPWTAIWRAQAIHQRNQIIECSRHAGSLKCPLENHKGSNKKVPFSCFHGFRALWFNKAMQEDQPNFKVTDRRLFNADGTPRDLPPEETPEPKVAATQEAAAAAPAPAPEAATPEPEVPPATAEAPPAEEEEFSEEDLADARDPASFVSFIMSIASNAASALGMMEHPVTHQREVDIELGKHWIDVLGMMQKKTEGNLTPQERRMLEGLLADLRMQYVSLVNSPQQGRRFTGSDITGGR